MPMISLDTHSVYHCGYPLFRSLPDLTTKIYYFDNLNKNRHFFIKSNCGCYINYSHTTYLDTDELDLR